MGKKPEWDKHRASKSQIEAVGWGSKDAAQLRKTVVEYNANSGICARVQHGNGGVVILSSIDLAQRFCRANHSANAWECQGCGVRAMLMAGELPRNMRVAA